MNGTPRVLLSALALLVLLTALAAAAALVWGPPWHEMRIWVDGHEWQMPAMHVGHWLVAAALLAVVFTLVAVLMPVVLLLSVALPLVAAAVVIAVLLLPLWLLVGIVWWLWRRDRRAARTGAPAA
jgi:hypothetical protein